jgi:hypothetical protein
MAVLAADSEGNRVLLSQTGGSGAAVTRLRPGFWRTLAVKMPALLGCYLGIALLGAAVLAVYGLLRFGRRLTLRIVTATFAACVLAVSAISCILTSTARRALPTSASRRLPRGVPPYWTAPPKQDVAALTGADFYGSESYAALRRGSCRSPARRRTARCCIPLNFTHRTNRRPSRVPAVPVRAVGRALTLSRLSWSS